MRLLELVLVVVVVGGSLAIGRAAWRAARQPRAGTATWQPAHRYEDGCRRVFVRRGTELEPVGAVAADDPDYDHLFMALMDRARERAAMLNSER